MPVSERGREQATIRVDHLPNGYWWGRVEMDVVGVVQTFECDSFHDVGEAFAWARGLVVDMIDAAKEALQDAG